MFDRVSGPVQSRVARTADEAVAIDQGLRDFMLGVYNNMTLGLGVTALVAFGAQMLASGNEAVFALLYASPLATVLMFAPLVFALGFGFLAPRLSASATQGAFYAFAVMMGLSLSHIFFVYTDRSIAQALFVAASAFGAVSLWGYTTKKDISGWGGPLIMALFGIIAASLVNFFFVGSDAMGFFVSLGVLVVCIGLTAWDTQRLKTMYLYGDMQGEEGMKASIFGAFSLYLNFINIFISLLRLVGERE